MRYVVQGTLSQLNSRMYVSVRAVDAALIAVQTQIEGSAMLNHGLVERRQEHVGGILLVAQRNHQQAMLLAGVATHYCGTMISACLICAQHLLGERLLEVYHEVLIKL